LSASVMRRFRTVIPGMVSIPIYWLLTYIPGAFTSCLSKWVNRHWTWDIPTKY